MRKIPLSKAEKNKNITEEKKVTKQLQGYWVKLAEKQKIKKNAMPNPVPKDHRQEKPTKKPPNSTSPESAALQQVHSTAPKNNPSTKAGQSQILEVSINYNPIPSNTGESETSTKIQITPGIQLDLDKKL